jgi:hypothetical protein
MKQTDIKCDIIINETQCNFIKETIEDLRCIWVSGETTKCQTIKYSCNEILSKATCERNGGAISSSSGENLSCVWVEEESLGKRCQEIRECDNIETLIICNQINTTNTTGGCIWLYDNNNEDSKSGTCKGKMNNLLKCENILRLSQCEEDDLGDTFLSDKCGIYEDRCEEKCSKLLVTDCILNNRNKDCIILSENSSISTNAECINKVIFYFYFLS